MSATMTPQTPPAAAVRLPLWTIVPGWGIAADLTPPEVVKVRQLRVLRRWIAIGLVMLLLVCSGIFYLVLRDNDDVAADLAAVSDQTRQLQADARRYTDVVSIQNQVRTIDGEVAEVMAADVDLVALMNEFQNGLPATMTITQQSIIIATSGVAATGSDASGAATIGTVSMSGTGQTVDDLPDYIDRLQAIPGVVDVVPLANALDGEEGTGTQFSLSLSLTDALLSHRFDTAG